MQSKANESFQLQSTPKLIQLGYLRIKTPAPTGTEFLNAQPVWCNTEINICYTSQQIGRSVAAGTVMYNSFVQDSRE